MIKSKKIKNYYKKRVYAVGCGMYGYITEVRIIADGNGIREEYTLDTGENDTWCVKKVVVLEKLDFLVKNNVIVAIAVVDGRTYVGHAILNPNDNNSWTRLGKRLALARALQDTDGEKSILRQVPKSSKEKSVEDTDEKELIAHCDCCYRPIYKGDNYMQTDCGNYACSDLCFHFLKEMENEEDEIEEDEDYYR